NAVGATLARATGTATIVDDDAAPPPTAPTLAIGDATFAEGSAAASGHGTFTVSLSAASATPVTVSYATANGTATAGSDYVAQSGTLTFASGETQKTIQVAAIGDAVVEANEGFTVVLTNPVGATLAEGSGAGTITNDDSTSPPAGHTTQINWSWGTNTHLDFNPATDILDFGWFQADSFTISEINGAVVIAIPTNNQTYTLDHTTLHDLHMSNILAKDASAVAEWSSLVAPTPPLPVVPGGADPAREFSPYIDMSMAVDADLVGISQAAGIKNFTLAFMLSSDHGIGWQGVGSITDDTLSNGSTMLAQVQAINAAGGNITISFGGANGQEAALTATSAAVLQAEYQSVIDRYQVDSIDFDIEGAAVLDTHSITLRNQALVGLEAANPDLKVSFTLPVLPDGLVASGVALLQSAKDAGVRIDLVNIMAMDYGEAVDNGGQMGLNAISAAEATQQQLAAIGLDAKIGITPMIGVNDTAGEVFTLADAQALVDYAQADPDVARLSMWSVARDNGNGAGNQWAVADTSGIAQNPYEFSSILNDFDHLV
ncbi:MAG: Calx-beta domain-containing protein, partial [Reyranella sp.]|nr:Calx-beta domain-containing protein [Reyranella sp.]